MFYTEYISNVDCLTSLNFSLLNSLQPNINKAITKAYKQDANNWKASTEPDSFTENGNILVARSVNVPNENSQFDIAGQQNMGGFLPGYALNKRADFLSKNLAINFFDTVDDIEHFFFRPWMIAFGIEGLLERNLLWPKVVLRQYDNRMRLRKGYEFREVFPTNVEGYQLSYNDEEFQEKSVTFAFRDYKPLPITGQALPFAF